MTMKVSTGTRVFQITMPVFDSASSLAPARFRPVNSTIRMVAMIRPVPLSRPSLLMKLRCDLNQCTDDR